MRRSTGCHTLLASIWVCHVVALVGQSAPSGMTLQQVLDVALQQNPDLVAARLHVDSARAEGSIARALPNPSYAAIPNVPFQYSVSTPIDLGPQRWFRTRAAGRGTAATQFDLADVTRLVTFDVRQTFYDLLLAQSLRGLALERRDIFRQLLVADSARLRSGDVPQRNVTKSELELARTEAELARADAGVRALRLALQLLMGVAAPDTGFQVAGELRYESVDLPLDSLAAIAAQSRPDLAAARRRVDQATSLHALTVWSLFPTPTLGLVYQPGGLFPSGSHYALGVSLELPLFYWYRGERARAQVAIDQSRVAVARAEAAVASELAQALDAWRAARTLAARYESSLLPKATAALETERYAYRTGATSQLDLLDAIRTYSDTRSEYYTTVHDYWVSLYALDRSVGKDLVQ